MSAARLRQAVAILWLLLAALYVAGGSRARADAGDIDSHWTLDNQLWSFYQWDRNGKQQEKLVLRLFQNRPFESGWTLRLREDLPLIITDKAGPDNESGTWAAGFGDAFVQALAVSPPVAPNTTTEFGLRIVFPTGGLPPFGKGSFQLGPMAAISHHLPEVADGLLLSPQARYMVSVAEVDAGAKPVRELQLYPRTRLAFDERWAVAAWVENPIIFDSVTNRWFVPLDLMVTYRPLEHLTLRIGGAVALIDDQPEYQQMIYGRLSLSF